MTHRRKSIAWLAVVVILVSSFLIAIESEDRVAVRAFPVDAASGAPLPEIVDNQLAVPWLDRRPSFGIAFSGGGTRSASATLGALRALHALGWLDRARYLSANSGGSWITVPFTWLPQAIDEHRFLGDYIPPEQLNDDNLRPTSADPQAMSTAIHNANTISELLELGRGDEAYADIVGSIFLQPFGLHDNEKFFTFHRGALEYILAGNPSLTENDFQAVERERPYPIVTTVLIGQQLSDDPDEYFPVDLTPLYTGTRGTFKFEKDDEIVVVGGGYVESFGYDSYEPRGDPVNGRYDVRLTGMLSRGDKPIGDRYRFTLSDVIGATSAAPLGTLTRHAIPNLLFPEFRHWSVDREAIDRADPRVRRKADEYQHGDGADMDNLALTPLLVRRTDNIIVFVNTEDAFKQPLSGCSDVTEEHLSDDIISYFRTSGVLVNNVVFDNDDGLAAICDAFAARKAAGEPLVYCQPYDVIANARHGIAPYRPNICWVYLDRVQRWIDQLVVANSDLVADLRARKGSFENFPHYLTFAEHGVALIDLNRERVIALTNFAAWMVYEIAPYIDDQLNVDLPVAPVR